MKTQELEVLSEAVRSENYRLHALQAQARSVVLLTSGDVITHSLAHSGLSAFFVAGDPPPDFNSNREGIDWERIAQKVGVRTPSIVRLSHRDTWQVSSASAVPRTARECEIRWLGELHPDFSNAQWTQSEIAKVKQLVAGACEGEVDWVEVAKKLGVGGTILQPCFCC